MRSHLLLTGLLVASASATIDAETVKTMLARPVMSRFWQTGTYVLGSRVNATQAAQALAGIKPSYVSGTYRFAYQDQVTEEMKQAYHTIRSAVLATSPHAKFDMELNLDPDPTSGHNATYPDAAAVISMMKYLNSELPFDGFFFDFLSTAQKRKPDWVQAVVNYAHSVNQTVGGNVFGTKIPPNVDFVSFVDNKDAAKPAFGYGVNKTMLKQLKARNEQGVPLVGHMNNNPQNEAKGTLSCDFILNWNATRRADYQDYWVGEQKSEGGFTYMFPVFFPQCPGLVAYDPLNDTIPETGGKTVYERIKGLALSDDE